MKKVLSLTSSLLAIFPILTISAQDIATLSVVFPKSSDDAVPVHAKVDGLHQNNGSFTIIAADDKKKTCDAQYIEGVLYWLIPGPVKAGTQKFALHQNKKSKPPSMSAAKQNGALVLQHRNQPLLSYGYETVYPPQGVDSAYKRSGFIHPLWSPNGQVLTRIQPKDHYHHYGIWNPWTHTLVKGDTIDFWNIGSGKATVRFSKFNSTINGSVLTGFESVHEHVILKPKPEQVAITEKQNWVVFQPSKDFYIIDFTSTLQSAISEPVVLLEYRYGGLGWRTTEKWNNKNSEVLTSAGRTRKDADGSKATWCIVQGAIDGDYAGMIMLSHPDNHNHPEPLRIWPENQYGRGDMFANFDPTKDMDWKLESGKEYVLRYRLIVFNNKMSAERAQTAWEYYANSPVVSVEKLKKRGP